MTENTLQIPPWAELAAKLDGDLHTDRTHQILYSTDASVYRSLPCAVVFPRHQADIIAVVHFANQYQLSITPRAGGTSLAGQAIGKGIIVDVSRYCNKLLEINTDEAWVRVESGLIRDELNAALAPLGYWFGPNTSTANRCTLGGMFGNNSCGTTSISVGNTRDHTLEAHCVLADGSTAVFKDLDFKVAQAKSKQQSLEGRIYQQLFSCLEIPENRESIHAAFPRPTIKRRNTGYALDLLARQAPFQQGGAPLNLCTLLAGSEGTLAFTTELKLRILPLPPRGRAVAALHFDEITAAMKAVSHCMAQQPFLCELMDDIILEAALKNTTQRRNSSFINGIPKALLLVEFRASDDASAQKLAEQLQVEIAGSQGYYTTRIVVGDAVDNVWSLRSAGLGLLANLPGDRKAVACIEDTAVALEDLADYIAEFGQLMDSYQQQAVYYAHAGAGEIHLRPILNLKASDDQQRFYEITAAVAKLVKKYRGSMSGEHGDGRVRAGFLPYLFGSAVYEMLRDVKRSWDPENRFNPGKIVDAPPMNTDLRYAPNQRTPTFDTALDFSETGGLLRLAEKCNGSGDCRKLNGGTMCPSYRASRREMDSTRGRANALREILTRETTGNPFTHPVLEEALDLCLSCKACTAECPSNVDMSSLKAEYLYQKQLTDGVPWRNRLFANIDMIYRWGSKFPWLANFFLRFAAPLKQVLHIAPQRSLPAFKRPLKLNAATSENHISNQNIVYFFADEFTRYQDVQIGEAALKLLDGLGYQVHYVDHAPSGRAHLSKGLLDQARTFADKNVSIFAPLVNAAAPLIGIEPSAILSFRDEYPKLLRGKLQVAAKSLAKHTYTITEFLHREWVAGRIKSSQFTDAPLSISLHGHCYEKALSDPDHIAQVLAIPRQYSVTQIPSGCCGMAGAFGYEKAHYRLSMQIGEAVLLPAVRTVSADTVIAASGTSCRHQILDGANRTAQHPAEILLAALLDI